MVNETRYWFPAKRHGWGWGPPTSWQGWTVLAAFVLMLVAGAVMLLPGGGERLFVAYALLLCLLLMAVCWLKGEPPRWRRGSKGPRT